METDRSLTWHLHECGGTSRENGFVGHWEILVCNTRYLLLAKLSAPELSRALAGLQASFLCARIITTVQNHTSRS